MSAGKHGGKRGQKPRKPRPLAAQPPRLGRPSSTRQPGYRAMAKLDAVFLHLEAGRGQDAMRVLRSVIRMYPSFDPAIKLLRSVCLDHGWMDVLAAGLDDALRAGNSDPDILSDLVIMAVRAGRGRQAAEYLSLYCSRFPRRRRVWRWDIADLQRRIEEMTGAPLPEAVPAPARPARAASVPTPAAPAPQAAPPATPSAAPPVRSAPPAPQPILPRPSLGPLRLTLAIDDRGFQERLMRGDCNDTRHHELCLAAHRLSMVNSIDELLCLPTLRDVREFWYQVETVRKVLRRFRGRALLCDEVGLGKTIEAGMIIKEYLLRGLIRSALVLVPPSLVAQWREEMLLKFGIDFATSDDPRLKRDPETFWRERPLIIASLALAKTERNAPRLAARQFDLIVVDEAHHLRNRATRAWKLVNSVKSRFLLLLTATPLQNNLEELHNLITLLAPGQLKTRAAFIHEFVSADDPTVPVNEEKLRELLSGVMVRNTRALAGLRLPARHASTLAVEPTPGERELYERLSALVRAGYRRTDGGGGLNRLTLRLLQSEAGSSPRAILRTLHRLLETSAPEAPVVAELRALADLARTLESHSKLDALAEHLQSSREKTIVFMSYRETLGLAADELRRRGNEVALFHGGLTTAEKEAAIDAFHNGARTLLTTEVGGEGRNLQFCHRLVNFDLPWNPMRIEQRIGRIHRIGQEREIEILNLCARGSVEDHLLEILDKKINLFELVIGEVDLILGQLEDRREFSERVLEAWAAAGSDEDAAANFARLSQELQQAKAKYEQIKSLDESLFGADYEV